MVRSTRGLCNSPNSLHLVRSGFLLASGSKVVFHGEVVNLFNRQQPPRDSVRSYAFETGRYRVAANRFCEPSL